MLELTFGQAITMIDTLANLEASSTEETLAKQFYNFYNSHFLTHRELDFTERTHSITTTSSTESYILPRYVSRPRNLKFTSGSNRYVVDPVFDVDEWTSLTSGVASSTIPTHYMLFMNSSNQYELHVHPISATASLTISMYYTHIQAEMQAADYSTGTVDAVTNGSGTVTGLGTTWTAAMIGRWIQLPDNQWYQITARASNTSITVTPVYSGTTLASGAGETYIIGEKSLLPAQFSLLPVWCAVRDIESSKSNPNTILLGQANNTIQTLRDQMWAIHGKRHSRGLVDERRHNFHDDPNDKSRVIIS